MSETIHCPNLLMLASGEFAIHDTSFGWRFLKQDDEDSFPRELTCTPDRLAMISAGRSSLPLYEMPQSFKTGFVRAFYGVSTEYSSFIPHPKGDEPAESCSCSNNLHRLLRDMGFDVGRRAVSKIRNSSPWELQLQLSPGNDAMVVGSQDENQRLVLPSITDESRGGHSSAATLAEKTAAKDDENMRCSVA